MDLISDGYKIMAFGFNDISYRRRELIIQPHRNPQYRDLCSSETPVTGQLFGDDLAKNVDDLLKGQKVGNKLSGFNSRDRPYKRQRNFRGGHVDINLAIISTAALPSLF